MLTRAQARVVAILASPNRSSGWANRARLTGAITSESEIRALGISRAVRALRLVEVVVQGAFQRRQWPGHGVDGGRLAGPGQSDASDVEHGGVGRERRGE